MSDRARSAAPRRVKVGIRLRGRHREDVILDEDSEALKDLFVALAGGSEGLLQIPGDGGRRALTFHCSQLVAVVTEPPVVVDLQDEAPAERPRVQRVSRPRWLVIDDFLSPAEHEAMLRMAIESESQFTRGTTEGTESEHRTNRSFIDFGETIHARLIANRLLTWYPFLARGLGLPVEALEGVESQLTAARHGEFYRAHSDSPRERQKRGRRISCVYYFHREPKAFSGGELRLFDRLEDEHGHGAADTFHDIEPVRNRLVAFPSSDWHEVRPVRCPSGAFADSRFAVTNWLVSADAPSPDTVHGWGHLRCGVVPEVFRGSGP